MFHEFKKRSCEELDKHLADMLFTNSLLHGEEVHEGNKNDQQHGTIRPPGRLFECTRFIEGGEREIVLRLYSSY